MTTPIDTLLGPFGVTAHTAALAAVLICPESGSNFFNSTILQLIIGSGSAWEKVFLLFINHLTPKGHYMGRTTQLTSRCCILYIYSTNKHSEYFKHAA